MATLLISNGRVLDPLRDLDEVRDVWIVDGKIASDGFAAAKPDAEIDATATLVMPGFVDVHVHLREPGNEPAETIETGCGAALAGGFTAIVCMPNTMPPLDRPDLLADVLEKADALKGPRVYAMGTITEGREGKVLADLQALSETGAVAFTDDGNGAQDGKLIVQAMHRAVKLRKPIVEHCENASLRGDGMVHDGPTAKRLGLPGYPAAAETAMIERDIRLSEETGAHIHFQHLSAARSVELVREAKARGAKVTAEVTPHHLTLTDEDAALGGTNFKMNPPLRSEQDREALQEALRDGTIDMIATDHAPHTSESKAKPFADAAFGVIGMETAVAVIWTRLVMEGLLTPLQMAARMSTSPAATFGLPGGTLAPGVLADVTVFDPSTRWEVDARRFRSKSRNCPFIGWSLQGHVTATIVGGEVRYHDDFR